MRLSPKPAKSTILSCIFMMLTLAWLTISLPFVFAAQQTAAFSKSAATSVPVDEQEDDSNNPFANTTEEKASSSVSSLSEEYLHDIASAEPYLTVPSVEYKVEHVSIYVAFHGELISPPPDAS